MKSCLKIQKVRKEITMITTRRKKFMLFGLGVAALLWHQTPSTAAGECRSGPAAPAIWNNCPTLPPGCSQEKKSTTYTGFMVTTTNKRTGLTVSQHCCYEKITYTKTCINAQGVRYSCPSCGSNQPCKDDYSLGQYTVPADCSDAGGICN